MVENINIISSGSSLLSDLIRATHAYYPLGFDFVNQQFDGFAKLQHIADTKIQRVREENFPDDIRLLQAEIESTFTGEHLYFEFFRDFPSYSFSIEVANDDFEIFSRRVLLQVRISLLTNYFTVFYEHGFLYKTVLNSLGHPHYAVLLSGSKKEEGNASYFSRIRLIVEQFFPEYKFVNHDLLFSVRTKGIPYKQDPNEPKRDYTLYDFLFDFRSDDKQTILP